MKGNFRAKIWRRIEEEICHFYTVIEWSNIEYIKVFAGNDFEKAMYFEDIKKYLPESEDTVQYFEAFYE